MVYSTTGLPISPSGQMRVEFSASEIADVMLTISGLMTSDVGGKEAAAAPNSLPLIIPQTTKHRSRQVGKSVPLTATAVDLDGSVVSLAFEEDGAVLAFTHIPTLQSSCILGYFSF